MHGGSFAMAGYKSIMIIKESAARRQSCQQRFASPHSAMRAERRSEARLNLWTSFVCVRSKMVA